MLSVRATAAGDLFIFSEFGRHQRHTCQPATNLSSNSDSPADAGTHELAEVTEHVSLPLRPLPPIAMASREDRTVLEEFGGILLDLVSNHATQRQWNEWLKVPLELSLRRGDSDLVSRLLVAGSVARVGSKGKDSHPLLLAAIAERHHDKEEGAAPEQGARGHESNLQSNVAKARTRQECSALLHDAVRRGEANMVSELLERGADVDIPDPDGRSPLRAAVSGCSLPVVTVLLEHGAGVSAVLLGKSPTRNTNAIRTADIGTIASPYICAHAETRYEEQTASVLKFAAAFPSLSPGPQNPSFPVDLNL